MNISRFPLLRRKDSFSFEEAHRIITESMGTHFDPKMLSIFEKAYPEIVAL